MTGALFCWILAPSAMAMTPLRLVQISETTNQLSWLYTIYLSIHPSIHPSIYLYVCIYIYTYIYVYIYIPSISHSCDALQQSPRSPSISPKKARATHPLPSASDLKPSLFPFAARCTMGYGGFSGMIVPTDE